MLPALCTGIPALKAFSMLYIVFPNLVFFKVKVSESSATHSQVAILCLKIGSNSILAPFAKTPLRFLLLGNLDRTPFIVMVAVRLGYTEAVQVFLKLPSKPSASQVNRFFVLHVDLMTNRMRLHLLRMPLPICRKN